MEIFEFKSKNRDHILALGAESAGNFSVFSRGKIYFSEDFGDLLENTNFAKYKKALYQFLRKNKIKPAIILTDLHPLYKTTALGKELEKKYKAKHIQIQHHVAHIFSAIGDKALQTKNHKPKTATGIALDGTGYGSDGKIWGGEIFQISRNKIARIGHLENQILIGGDLAIKEPARFLLAMLNEFVDKVSLCGYMERFYTRNEFEVLYNQLQQNFNCQETSSTGRILDAVSLLLGFAENKRKYKHEAAYLLEKNSTRPYTDLKPKVVYDKKEKLYILQTTPLFEYLIKNIKKDKKRLAATAQLYIAQGLYEIIKKSKAKNIFLAGGITNNKIISSYFESKDAWKNSPSRIAPQAHPAKRGIPQGKKIYPVKSERSEFNGVPRGDAGLSFGQITYHILSPK